MRQGLTKNEETNHDQGMNVEGVAKVGECGKRVLLPFKDDLKRSEND